MRRYVTMAMLVVALVGCQGHPVSVKVNKAFNRAEGDTFVFEKIAVLPFTSALNAADDPDGDAPRTLAKFFTPSLDGRGDYVFVSTGTVQSAVDIEGWQDEYRKFLDTYPKSDKPDMDFLGRLARVLQCDAFLIPVVDTWYKDEVDITESASATTTVGATITIIDAKEKPGRILFRAVDEDTDESARSEMEDRSLVTSSSGIVRADQGARVYKAPPYEDVAVRVAEALVLSLPAR